MTKASVVMAGLGAVLEAAHAAGWEIGKGWLRAAQEDDNTPDAVYDFSGDCDWTYIRDAVRSAAGSRADEVWDADDTQPAREYSREIWAAARRGYLLAIGAALRATGVAV